MRTDQKLLYFSLNKESVDSFYDYLDGSIWEIKDSFRRAINREKAKQFLHASDLMFFLDGQKTPEAYYVIIDYLSFYNLQFNKKEKIINTEDESDSKKENLHSPTPVINLEQFSVQEAAKDIRRTILKYPETMFLFDESWLKASEHRSDNVINFCNFLFYGNNTVVSSINVEYHQYSVCNNEDPFLAIRRDRSNLFDGSNLRYAIMRYMYESLKVERFNFSIMQNSRKDNLALVVEEEMAQNCFNSYCLYANGFRVIPISSSKDLKYFNGKCYNCNEKNNDNSIKVNLVLRDFDLQFDDVDDRSSNKLSIIINNERVEELDIYEVDRIRSAKRGFKNKFWYLLEEEIKNIQTEISLKWLDGEVFKNEYWSNLRSIPTYFISKGLSNIQIQKEGEFLDIIDGSQIIPGLHKPVAGVYESFRSLDTINQISTRALNYGNKKSDNNQNQAYYINTDRKNHEHGVPLDIYDLVKSMVSRAKRYQNDNKYTLSAIVALDAIEIMNGFHEQLMLKAYHIAAVSENAIAMNVFGGDEQALKTDAIFRINKINNDICRLIARPDKNDRERSNLMQNVLCQIFSDCRNYCKDKEHFEAEEAFISAMAHLTEGIKLKDIKVGFGIWFCSLKESVARFIDSCIEMEIKDLLNRISQLTEQISNNGIESDTKEKIKLKKQFKKITGKTWNPITITGSGDGFSFIEYSNGQPFSSNENVIEFGNDGSMILKKDGTTTITYIDKNKGKITSFPIIVKQNEKK